MRQSDVTIIIPHLGAEPSQCFSLNHCLQSLRETFAGKIIVVKNGNKRCMCARHMRIIEQGQCKAVNAAAAIVDTPWIMVTNDDMIYSKGWFERLTDDLLLSDAKLAIKCISPKLVEPRPGAPTFDVFFAGGAGGDFNKKLWDGYAEDYYEHHYGIRPGFNLPFLIRKDLWDLIGGYDVKFDPWGSNSDSDLLYKIRLAGVQPYQNCNSIVYHFSQTSGTFEPRNSNFWGKNWQYFIDKWGFERTDHRIWEADFTIPTERKFLPWWENYFK